MFKERVNDFMAFVLEYVTMTEKGQKLSEIDDIIYRGPLT